VVKLIPKQNRKKGKATFRIKRSRTWDNRPLMMAITRANELGSEGKRIYKTDHTVFSNGFDKITLWWEIIAPVSKRVAWRKGKTLGK